MNPLEQLKNNFTELYYWIEKICRWGSIADFTVINIIDSKLAHNQLTKGRITIDIYTKDHEYRISASRGDENQPGYLGCTVSNRKPRAGEDWTRGSDLADGPYNEYTWDRIIHDIVRYELVRISKPKEEKKVPDESISKRPSPSNDECTWERISESDGTKEVDPATLLVDSYIDNFRQRVLKGIPSGKGQVKEAHP